MSEVKIQVVRGIPGSILEGLNNSVVTATTAANEAAASAATIGGFLDYTATAKTLEIITKAPWVNVKAFGALVSPFDSTTAINNAIQYAPAGSIVYVPPGDFNVTTIVLKSDIKLVCDGTLIQTTTPGLEVFSSSTFQSSSYPLIKGTSVSNVDLYINTDSNYEAIQLTSCSNIRVFKSKLKGNVADNTFPGVITYQCQDIELYNTEVYNFGAVRSSTSVYTDGTGIRALVTNGLKVHNCNIHNNGENGVFTWACQNVNIKDGKCIANGMSGIQIAFSGSGTEKHYHISNMIITDNCADCIDINNGAYSLLDLDIVINKITSNNNGFVSGLATADGSGIATLRKITGAKITNSASTLCNNGMLYIENCGTVIADNNTSDNYIEIQGTFDKITISNNIITFVSCLGSVNGTLLKIESNKLTGISLPNNITIKQLEITKSNNLSSAEINLNMTSDIIKILDNVMVKASGNESILISGTNIKRLMIDRNEIDHQSTTSIGVRIMTACPNAKIRDNNIKSLNVCIQDSASPSIEIEGNNLTGVVGGYMTPRTISIANPNNSRIRNNIHTSPASNTIVLTGSGNAIIDNETTISGFVDYGTCKYKIDGQYQLSAAPTTNTWSVKDKVYNTAPTLIKNISYWECITAGTPGTWVAYGCGTGTTANRPTLTTNDTGYLYRDTTTSTIVFWNGTAWI